MDIELAGSGATPLGQGARQLTQLTFADERTFRATGTIDCGGSGLLRVSTIGAGLLSRVPQSVVRHGTAVLEVRGTGRLHGVRGRITSNFVVSDDGDVTDEQVVLVFDEREEQDDG